MNKHLEKQVKLLRNFSTLELRDSIARMECILEDYPHAGEYGILEYIEHLKREYAERIGK